MKENLIIVRAGDNSTHPSWFEGGEPNFDLFVSYYGGLLDKWRSSGNYYHAAHGPKYPVLHQLLDQQWDMFKGYKYIAIPDDDIGCTATDWNNLFRLCTEYKLDLAQPAIKGPVGWPFTALVPGRILRYTNFVEIMCPIFLTSVLKIVRWMFPENVSGWGIDMLWSDFLRHPRFTLGIIDAVPVTHTRPLKTGDLYNLLQNHGLDPMSELHSIQQKYRLPPFVYQEYGVVYP